MNITASAQTSSPAHLVEALGKKPLNKPELMTYLANLQVYNEYHLQQAKDSNYNGEHPYHSDEGKVAFYAEVSAIHDVFGAIIEDMKGATITLQAKDLRYIGDIVGNAQFTLEKALATYLTPFRGQVKPAHLSDEGVSHAR